MPSFRVTESNIWLRQFEVIGQDGRESDFIGHLGLADSGGSQNAASIHVIDMGPPLHGHVNSAHMKADVVGLAELTEDEIRKIKTFVDRRSNEHLLFSKFKMSDLIRAVPKMYCVLPHTSPLYEDDGRYVRTRFSCAGFVLEAYKKARIELLNTNDLPMVDMSIITAAYPQTQFIESGIISAVDLGIGGPGPWPVLLCG